MDQSRNTKSRKLVTSKSTTSILPPPLVSYDTLGRPLGKVGHFQLLPKNSYRLTGLIFLPPSRQVRLPCRLRSHFSKLRRLHTSRRHLSLECQRPHIRYANSHRVYFVSHGTIDLYVNTTFTRTAKKPTVESWFVELRVFYSFSE